MAKKRDKMKRYAALKNMRHVFEMGEISPQDFAGKWRKIFGNNNPITLELACGKGDYTLALAKMYPNRNFIGVDIKGARLFIGGKESQENNLGNVRFLRIYIDHITDYFAPEEVDEIWITFPDPHPTDKGERKRLTNHTFLDRYVHFLKPHGKIHLKTDSELLFEYTLDVLHEKNIQPQMTLYNIDTSPEISLELQEMLDIQTYYEGMHRKKGIPIHYISFNLQG